MPTGGRGPGQRWALQGTARHAAKDMQVPDMQMPAALRVPAGVQFMTSRRHIVAFKLSFVRCLQTGTEALQCLTSM